MQTRANNWTASRARLAARDSRVRRAARDRREVPRSELVVVTTPARSSLSHGVERWVGIDAVQEGGQSKRDSPSGPFQRGVAGVGHRTPHAQRAEARAREAEATRSNLGLGHDLRAGLLDPTEAQRQALKAIVCHLLARHQRELIAYVAGWSDHDRQQPVGDSGRHEPRQTDAIVDAELQRALEDPDPLRAIAGLVARWSAAFVLDPDAVTRTKALGAERMARRLRDALPGGQHPLRAAVWDFVRPMLSPRLAALHRDAFAIDDGPQSSVDLAAHRGDSSLEELDIGEQDAVAA
jgi:hypothetical protein